MSMPALLATASMALAASFPPLNAASPGTVLEPGVVLVGEEGKSAAAEKTPASLEEGQSALEHASRTKRESHGKEAEEKYEILLRAVKEYEEVASMYSTLAEIAGEAWFRAGEIYRTVRRVEDAQRCFQAAADLVENSAFASRALNEIAHLHRRTDRFDEALALYESVEKKFPDERKECVKARTWQGKMLLELGRQEEGEQRLLSVGHDYADFPVEDVRNVDLVATAWHKAGRVEDCRKLVDECLQRHADAPDSANALSAEVQRAIDKMKARELLDTPEADQ
jgi:tetratricopeptide (TPR) repeat protein